MYNNLLYCTVEYITVQYNTVHYNILLFRFVLYCIVLYGTLLYSTVQYSTVQHVTVQYSTVMCCTVQYCIAHYCTIQYSTALYSILLYNTVQYSTEQHIILQSISFLYLSQSQSLTHEVSRYATHLPHTAPYARQSLCSVRFIKHPISFELLSTNSSVCAIKKAKRWQWYCEGISKVQIWARGKKRAEWKWILFILDLTVQIVLQQAA